MPKCTHLSIVCSILANLANAQQPVWIDHFGNGSTGNSPFVLAGDGANALYALGGFAGPPMVVGSDTIDQLGSRDILLVKLDTSGIVQWVRNAGGACLPSDNEYGTGVTIDPTLDRLLITGLLNCPISYFGDFPVYGSGTVDADDGFIAAYDSAGTCLWATSAEGFDVRPEIGRASCRERV